MVNEFSETSVELRGLWALVPGVFFSIVGPMPAKGAEVNNVNKTLQVV